MKVNIESIHFDADKKLLQFIDEKCQKLTQFFDGIVNVEVILKLQNTKIKEDGNKIVEIKVFVPSKTLFAEEQSKTFEEATDVCVDSLKKQIIKYKEKTRD